MTEQAHRQLEQLAVWRAQLLAAVVSPRAEEARLAALSPAEVEALHRWVEQATERLPERAVVTEKGRESTG